MNLTLIVVHKTKYTGDDSPSFRLLVVLPTGHFTYALFPYDKSWFAYVLKHVLQQLIYVLYVRSHLDDSQSIQFLKQDFVCWINQLILTTALEFSCLKTHKIKLIEAK